MTDTSAAPAPKFHVKKLVDATKLREDLQIDENNLSGSMMVQAGHFAYYATLAAEAELQLNKLEQLGEITEARMNKAIRQRFIDAGQKATESMIAAEIALDPKVVRVRTAINEAAMVVTLAKSAADSFRHKRDMLIQLATNQREEYKGQLRVGDNSERMEANRLERHDRVRSLRQG